MDCAGAVGREVREVGRGRGEGWRGREEGGVEVREGGREGGRNHLLEIIFLKVIVLKIKSVVFHYTTKNVTYW